jgi:hypothetical protein
VRFHDHLRHLLRRVVSLATAQLVCSALRPAAPEVGRGIDRWHRAMFFLSPRNTCANCSTLISVFFGMRRT